MPTQLSVNDNTLWKTRFFTIWGGQAVSIIGSQPVQMVLVLRAALCSQMAVCGWFIPAVVQTESRYSTMPGDVSQSLSLSAKVGAL